MSRLSFNLLILVAVSVTAVFVDTRAARSQEAFVADARLPIAKHEVRPSTVKILDGREATPEILPSVLFPVDTANRPVGAGTYDVLPNCTESSVDREPLAEKSEGIENMDVLYFSPDDSAQVKRAATYPGLALPFIETAVVNPYYGGYNRLQCFARTVRLRCLPARFRYVTIEGQRVAEYRRGDRAWDNQ